MKRGFYSIVLVFILFLISFFVSAEDTEESSDFDLNKGFDWLYNEMEEVGWNTNIDSLSWSILALRNKGYDVDKGVERLKQLRNANYNWNNNVYETSLAILALDKTGNNVDAELTWLLDRQREALKSGEWLIQFLYDGESECKIRYDGEDFDFNINQTEIISPSDCAVGDNWVNFEDCIKKDEADMEETFSVSCLDNVETSLLFKSNNEYYIVDQSKPLKIENACFYGEYSGCTCSVTQYASWVLQQLGEEILTIPYLKSNCNERISDLSFLYMLTSGRIYSDKIIEDRAVDGGWENDFEITSMAIIALRDSPSIVASSINWLKHFQEPDGSWEGDIRTTAKVLYSMVPEVPDNIELINQTNQTILPTCGNGFVDVGEECEYDLDCSGDLICENCFCVNVPKCELNEDCAIGEECILGKCVDKAECVVNSDCVSAYGPEYYCDGGKCKKATGVDDECNTDSDCTSIYGGGWICDESGNCVEKESGWVTWVIVILVILVGLIGGYLGYKQFFKGKIGFGKGNSGYTPKNFTGKKNEYQPTNSNRTNSVPVRRPVAPPNTGKEDYIERKLDDSLRKAKELLGKK